MLAELAEMKRLGVSQMELTNKFDNAFTGVAGDRDHRPADQQRQLPQHRVLPADAECPAAYAPGTEDRLQSPNLGDLDGLGGGRQSTPDRTRIFGAIWKLFGDLGVQPAPSTRPAALQPARAQPARRAAALGDDRPADPLRPRPHERRRAQRRPRLPRAAAGRRSSRRRRVVPLVVHTRRLPTDLPPRRLRRSLRRRLDRLRREVAPAPRLDRPRFYFGFGFGSDMNGFGAQATRAGRRGRPGDVPLHRSHGVRHRSAAASGSTTQHRRCRPLRLYADWSRRRARGGRRRAGARADLPAAPRPTSRLGARRAAWPPTRAATRACDARAARSPAPPTPGSVSAPSCGGSVSRGSGSAASSPTARRSRAGSGC